VWAKPNEGASFRLTRPRVHNQNFSQSPLPLPPKSKPASLADQAEVKTGGDQNA
jgi:hypothetical protein